MTFLMKAFFPNVNVAEAWPKHGMVFFMSNFKKILCNLFVHFFKCPLGGAFFSLLGLTLNFSLGFLCAVRMGRRRIRQLASCRWSWRGRGGQVTSPPRHMTLPTGSEWAGGASRCCPSLSTSFALMVKECRAAKEKKKHTLTCCCSSSRPSFVGKKKPLRADRKLVDWEVCEFDVHSCRSSV